MIVSAAFLVVGLGVFLWPHPKIGELGFVMNF